MRRRGKHATPLRTFALLRAIVDDEHFSELGSPAQAALLASVIKWADKDGWWLVKQSTLGEALGRSDRRVRDALTAGRDHFLQITETRRFDDGTQGPNEYKLSPTVIKQADENVRLWTSKTKTSGSSRTETSGGAGEDENVPLTSPDETVRAEAALDGSLNGLAAEVAAEQPSEMSDEDFEAWVAKVGSSEFGQTLVDTARRARGEAS